MVVLTGFVPPRRLPARALDALSAKLAELRGSPPARIGNLGTGQWIEIGDASLNP